jgi:chromate transporter
MFTRGSPARSSDRGYRPFVLPLPEDERPRSSLGEIARLFTKLGVIGFGGPAAHIAMMRDEAVVRRRWLTDQEFLDIVGATNLVPGPNSTEVAIHLGHRRAGRAGLVVAGMCFILPAVVIVLAIAWAYDRWGAEPAAVDLRYGILPVIVAVVGQAIWGLGRTAVRSPLLAVITAGTGAAWLAGVNELLLLAAAGLVNALWVQRRSIGRRASAAWILPFGLLAQAEASGEVGLWRLFVVFLKIGSVLYGSGYVLLSFLERDVVERYGWLTETQLLDAIAVGQVTPGPVFTTATFVGYQAAGLPGAAVATVGIFLPAFLFVAALAWIVPRIRRSAWAGAALDGVNAASLGLMAAVLVRLADDALPDAFTVALAAMALVVLLRWRPNSAWLVGAGAAVGLLHGLIS